MVTGDIIDAINGVPLASYGNDDAFECVHPHAFVIGATVRLGLRRGVDISFVVVDDLPE